MTEREIWTVIDSSKIQDYLMCPRCYLFKHVLGWSPEAANVHLEFGAAWHLAMERLLSTGYTAEGCLQAFNALTAHYRTHFPAEMDDVNAPKNPANAFRALPQYCEHYRADAFEILHVEVAGSVAISATRLLYFKTDCIAHDERGYFSLEHKTGSRYSSNWAAEWLLKIQTGSYSHVLHCLYPSAEIYGVIINGAFIKNAPRTKKDGTLYAGDVDTEFHRVPIRRNLASMESWISDVNSWMDDLDRDHQRLNEASESDSHLKAFRRNPESCTHYGICPFHDYCSVWHNPLAHADSPPLGYTLKWWDPRGMEHVKETMSL